MRVSVSWGSLFLGVHIINSVIYLGSMLLGAPEFWKLPHQGWTWGSYRDHILAPTKVLYWFHVIFASQEQQPQLM